MKKQCKIKNKNLAFCFSLCIMNVYTYNSPAEGVSEMNENDRGVFSALPIGRQNGIRLRVFNKNAEGQK